jgi:hypothetical protein
MKISITIDILPSEVNALITALQPMPPAAPSAPLPADIVEDLAPEAFKFVRVADIEMNRINDFWKARIGQIGRITEGRGDKWDVHFTLDPFPCKDIDPQRFMPVTA